MAPSRADTLAKGFCDYFKVKKLPAESEILIEILAQTHNETQERIAELLGRKVPTTSAGQALKGKHEKET